METIGFVGLGQMGSRMAARLIGSGFGVIAYDSDAAALVALEARGAKRARSARDVADRAAVVLCSLPRPEIVEQVILGADGLIEGRALEVVVDLSTTGPSKLISIAAALAAKEIELVDAPVSGGTGGAEAGTLTLMIAGSPTARDRVAPFLDALGSAVFVIGDEAGLGQRMKLVNNMLCAANAVAAFEALVLGVKSGLDAQIMLDVINTSSGRSFITTDKVPQCVMPRTFPPRFATELLLKDLELGIAEAQADGAPLRLMPEVRTFIREAMAEGDPKADYASLIRYFERRAGIEVGAAVQGAAGP